jgi:hypothetical protein
MPERSSGIWLPTQKGPRGAPPVQHTEAMTTFKKDVIITWL